MKFEEIYINLNDSEWKFNGIIHTRKIVRAIVFDDEKNLYFLRVKRNDDFGDSILIETSGGGVEEGENLEKAICRELKEELGADIEIITKLGVVSDYYNLIHRHNLNNYFLCRVKSFGEKNMTKEELEEFDLSTLKLTFDQAKNEYMKCSNSKIGRLIFNREMPILKLAINYINENFKKNIL